MATPLLRGSWVLFTMPGEVGEHGRGSIVQYNGFGGRDPSATHNIAPSPQQAAAAVV